MTTEKQERLTWGDWLDIIATVILVVLLVFLVGVFGVVVWCEKPEWIALHLGLKGFVSPKYEVLKFLGLGMGGILLALQALASHKRAKAMECAANAQAKATEATEEGHRQERLKNAIEHLGHESVSVRLGGAYELFHLADDTSKLRKTALDILCAHVRRTTGEGKYQETNKTKPSEEVQSLLYLLFVQEHKVFRECYPDLRGSWMNGADLMDARLGKAVLLGAYLENANLLRAHLQGAKLRLAHLQGAYLNVARLQGAELRLAHLQGTGLRLAHLQGADLRLAHLQGADLRGAHLQGADLRLAHLQGADLRGAHLQGAGLQGAQMQAADLSRADLRGAGNHGLLSLTPFEDHMNSFCDTEDDLSEVVFEGGLSQGDVDVFVKDLSDEKANKLRSELEPHIGPEGRKGLPENCGAVTGKYTSEEAERWIVEYEQAMSEVPMENDS